MRSPARSPTGDTATAPVPRADQRPRVVRRPPCSAGCTSSSRATRAAPRTTCRCSTRSRASSRRTRSQRACAAAGRTPRVAAHDVLLSGRRDPAEDRARREGSSSSGSSSGRRSRSTPPPPRSCARSCSRRRRCSAPRCWSPRAGSRYLALDMHHIISDGTSIDVLLEDLLALIANERAVLPARRLRYFDYAAWLESDAGQAAARGSARVLGGAAARRAARARSAVRFPRGPLTRQQAAGEVTVELPAADGRRRSRRTRARARRRRSRSSPAIYSVFLSCIERQRRGRVRVPDRGPPAPRLRARRRHVRQHAAVSRAHRRGDETFDELLRRSMTQIRESLRNEDYPFEDLVDDLRLPPAPGRNPMFDTMLSYEGRMPDEYRCGDAVLRERRLRSTRRADGSRRRDPRAARAAAAASGSSTRRICSSARRSSDSRATSSGIVEHVLAEPAPTLAELHTLGEAERDRLLHGVQRDRARSCPRCARSTSCSSVTPPSGRDAVAVEMGDTRLTYAEVERAGERARARAARQGHRPRLRSSAILLEPCVEMLVGVLGVLKAGGGVPADRSGLSDRAQDPHARATAARACC